MRSSLNIFLSFIVMVWFIASIIMIIFMSRTPGMKWLALVIFGQLFLVFGIIGFITMFSNHKKELWIDIIAMFSGVLTIVLPLIYHYGNEQAKAAVMHLIPKLTGAAFLLTGLCISVTRFLMQRYYAKKYSTPIEGVCVDHDTHISTNQTAIFSPVYEITLNGETLRLQNGEYSALGIPAIGERRTIYIDEKDLSSYREPVFSRYSGIIVYFIAVPMVIAGVIILILT